MFCYRLIRISVVSLSLILIVMAASPVAAAMPSAATYLSGCTGEYFNNPTLAAPSVTTRTDGAINFFWPENSAPAAGLYWNNYSVRWTCGVNFPTSDNYTFTVTTDDGMNVLVDGHLVLWAFYDQGPTTYYPVYYINSGYHTVTIEYYNRVNAGTARVSYQQGAFYAPSSSPYSSSTSANFYGEYFNNQSLSGSPVFTRNDSSINFNWGTGSPDGSVPSDHWSARWTANPYFGAGTWQFTAGADDGLRLWVDSSLLIDRWYNQSYGQNSASITLGAGNHTVKLEYYDDIVNAQVSLGFNQTGGTSYVPPASYVPPPVYVPAPYVPPPYYVPPPAVPVLPAYNTSTSGAWHGQYFNNVSLSGSPVLTRDDATLNFNWGEGSPGAGVPVDFSARWDSTQNFPASDNFTFSAISDDGIRVWIDGALIIDQWYDHGPTTTFTATRYETAGPHNMHVDYYDSNLGAVAILQIQASGAYVPPMYGLTYPQLPQTQYYGYGASTTGVWHGQFYNNIWLTGSPVAKQDVNTLNVNWGEGRPLAGVNKDFSAKWDSVQNAPYSGNYFIQAAADDGVRLSIDGQLVIDGWYDHLPTNFTATRYLAAGPHNVHVDFYDSNLGAMINVQITGQ